MPEQINWLHITDLHCGLDSSGWLWPRIRHEFFKDVEKLADDIGGWDVVFFTGDMTQSGRSAEYESLSRELEEIWKVLSKAGRSPLLAVVPGNHDLVRPPVDSHALKIITRLWWTDPDVRKQFWLDESCESRKAVENCFGNYSNWLNSLQVPKVEMTLGLLPGDFSATIERGKVRLGIVGLNSTFLQMSDGDYKGKLDLHVSQLSRVCSGDSSGWLKKRTTNVLLTHQPPSWLSSEALLDFRQEIYVPGSFISQLCGHQHEPESWETTEAGAMPRRLRQGPSLFGLEKWNGLNSPQRMHGYTAGQFVFEESGGIEKLWPRIAHHGHHGGLNIAPDHGYKLEDNCVATRFDLNETDTKTNAAAGVSVAPNISSEGVELLAANPNHVLAKEQLAICPRLANGSRTEHKNIRLEEQSQFELEIRKSRIIWLTADWGIGQNEFVFSGVQRFQNVDSACEIFHIKCDEATDVDTFEAMFAQQCGVSLQVFCALLAPLKSAFLLLDGIHPAICAGDQYARFKRIVSAIGDYCPDLRIVVASRFRPAGDTEIAVVELKPLEVPDVRTYLTYHPDATPDLREPDVVEKIHEHTGGLPKYLDEMLKALKVSSLATVLEEGMARLPGTQDTPQGLVNMVSLLAMTLEKRSRRSFKLLKVLSILPYGETLDALKHYLPTEPFFYENAVELKDLALLDVVSLQQTTPQVGISSDEQKAPKLLKVPRPVRDYVNSLVTDKERNEFVIAGVERYFGRRWRESKIKLRSIPFEYKEYLDSGPGNEFALIQSLIALGRKSGDESLIEKAGALGVQYSRHLRDHERYRDLTTVSGGFVQTVDRDEYPAHWAQLSFLYGVGLRMTGKLDEALKYLRAALDVGADSFTREQKSYVWLDIALAHEKNNKEEALIAAKKVQEFSEAGSGVFMQATSIVADITLSGDPRRKKLLSLEKEARSEGKLDIADNIALDMAAEETNLVERVKLYDRVLSERASGYNAVRAIVAKAGVVEQIAGEKLKPTEIVLLSAAYSYLHAQRFRGIFDRCHSALWGIFESEGNDAQLLRLFRHSSFVWRIRGDGVKESSYIARLDSRKISSRESGLQMSRLELGYFLRRLKFTIVNPVPQPGISAQQ